MRYSVALRMLLIAIFICLNTSLTLPTVADDGEHLLTVDHYVSVRSTVPFLAGQIAQIYVRERLRPGTVLRAASVAGRHRKTSRCRPMCSCPTPRSGSADLPYSPGLRP